MYDEYLLHVNGSAAEVVDQTTLPALSLEERKHLQEWVVQHPRLLGAGVEIVTTEYGRWQAADGASILDRLDVLGLGRDGRLVVAELKRDLAPSTVHLQAVNYAAMVSRLTPRDIAELWTQTHATSERPLDVESVLVDLESNRLLTVDSIRAPRIVLLASSFPPSVTASVVRLNEQGVDVTLIRFRPYRLDTGQVLVTFTRTYSVPDVEEFTVSRHRQSHSGNDDVRVDDVPWGRQACPCRTSWRTPTSPPDRSRVSSPALPCAYGTRVTASRSHSRPCASRGSLVAWPRIRCPSSLRSCGDRFAVSPSRQRRTSSRARRRLLLSPRPTWANPALSKSDALRRAVWSDGGR